MPKLNEVTIYKENYQKCDICELIFRKEKIRCPRCGHTIAKEIEASRDYNCDVEL